MMTKWRLLFILFFILIASPVFLADGAETAWGITMMDGAGQGAPALSLPNGGSETRQETYPSDSGLGGSDTRGTSIASEYGDAFFTFGGRPFDDKHRASPAGSDPQEKLNPQKESSGGESIQTQVRENYGRLPLYFIQNDGQTDERVKYYEKGAGHAMFFTEDGIYLSLTNRQETRSQKPEIRNQKSETR